MNNNLGEKMPLNPPIPIVSDLQLKEVLDFTKACKPDEADFSDIETVLSWVGRLLVGTYAIPTELLAWLASVPRMRLVGCEVLCNTILGNGFNMTAKRVESAFFAQVTLLSFDDLEDFAISAEDMQPPTEGTDNANREK